jgi:hypothetical protein
MMSIMRMARRRWGNRRIGRTVTNLSKLTPA